MRPRVRVPPSAPLWIARNSTLTASPIFDWTSLLGCEKFLSGMGARRRSRRSASLRLDCPGYVPAGRPPTPWTPTLDSPPPSEPPRSGSTVNSPRVVAVPARVRGGGCRIERVGEARQPEGDGAQGRADGWRWRPSAGGANPLQQAVMRWGGFESPYLHQITLATGFGRMRRSEARNRSLGRPPQVCARLTGENG